MDGFRVSRRLHVALGELLTQTIIMVDRAGLLKLNHVSVDGTKVKANASNHSAMSYGRMKKAEKRLRQEIERYLKEMEENDRNKDKMYGNRRGNELPEKLSTREKRLKKIQKMKAQLEAEARKKEEKRQAERKAKAEKEGKEYKPRKEPKDVTPDDKDQRNFTDGDSRIMLSSDR